MGKTEYMRIAKTVVGVVASIAAEKLFDKVIRKIV